MSFFKWAMFATFAISLDASATVTGNTAKLEYLNPIVENTIQIEQRVANYLLLNMPSENNLVIHNKFDYSLTFSSDVWQHRVKANEDVEIPCTENQQYFVSVQRSFSSENLGNSMILYCGDRFLVGVQSDE